MTTTSTANLLRLDAAFLVGAPVLLLASTILGIGGAGIGNDDVAGVVQVFCGAAFIGALFAVVRMAERAGASSGWLVAVMLLGVLGMTGMGLYGLNGVYADLGSLDLNEEGTVASFLALQLPGICFPATWVAAAGMLVRCGAIPGWQAVVLAAAAVLFPASRIPGIDLLALLSDALFIVAFVPLALKVLTPSGNRGSAADSLAHRSA